MFFVNSANINIIFFLFQPDIIKKTGYPFIQYKIKTIDKYILTVFRIPRVGSVKPAVFLLHGVQGTSAIFVGLGRNSLGIVIY